MKQSQNTKTIKFMIKKTMWEYLFPKIYLTNFLLTMKISIVLTFCLSMQITAGVYSQSAKLKLVNKQNTMADVIEAIENQTEYKIFYRTGQFDTNMPVSLTSTDQTVASLLVEAFDGSSYTYKLLDKIIVITPTEALQQQTITGTVTDATTKEPLPGVNVVVEGTTVGVTTDFEGKYSIKLPSETAVLVFSYIGYLSEKIEAGGKTEINVSLVADVQSLEEVVVIGYGTQRQEAVTGSVASIKGDVVRGVPSSNITQSLQGRVAGVQLDQTSSKPGAAMQIRIRGTRSLNASNDPLVVLDGIPFAGTISDINTNNIKSVDILKDASATAIYGSRGANGVILITTNKGGAGQSAKMNFNSYTGLKTAFGRYPMMDGPTFVKLREYANKYTTNGTSESNDTNTDWQDLLYRTAKVTSQDLSIAGGTNTGSYNFGVGYYKDEAILPLQDFTRFSLQTSIDQEIGKYFRFGFSTNSNYSITNGSSISVATALSISPIASPYNEDGTLRREVNLAADDYWVYTEESLNNLGDKYKEQTRSYGTYNNLYGEVKIPWVEGLKYRINVGLNYRQSNYGKYQGEGVFSTTEDQESTATITNSHTINWTVENLLTYDRTFAQKHQVNVVAMYSAENNSYNKSEVSAKDISSDQFQYYNLGYAEGETTVDPDKQSYSESGLQSVMGRVLYSYDDRYMLTAAFRSDGSSRLAKGHQWHAYPAVSVGWNIMKETFMQNITSIRMLKLRLGYGQTANQAIDPYSTLGGLGIRPYNYGDESALGYYVSKLPNENLGWEYSDTWNIGVDFSLLKSRLTGSIEYYIIKTHDLLLSVDLPASSGADSYYANVGETQNKGLEFSLNGVIVDNLNGWTWEAGINVYANRNKLTQLSSGVNENTTNGWFVGHPVDVIYDYKKVGLWNESDKDYQFIKNYESNGTAGMIKVQYTGDYNDDGSPTRTIGTDDKQVQEVEPDFMGGFNTRVAYKGFDLSVIGAFKKGGTLISTLYGSSGYLNMLSGRRGNVDVDYWTEENTGAKYPKPGGPMDGDNPKYGSTLGYFDASYMKVRTITLGYNFENNKWIKNAGIDKLRVYCTVQNPFVLFSPYNRESGMDPETNSYGDENQAVTTSYNKRTLIIGTNTPSTRNYLIGLNLTF
jgi:TonB-linked SusC/RagA family outer membrane protein